MMRAYLDRMLRPRDVTFRYHAGGFENMGDAAARASGMLVTSEALTQDEVNGLRSYLATKPDLVDGQIVKMPRSRDRSPLKLW